MKRHDSREQALIFLFENSFGLNTPEEILDLAQQLREEKISNFSKQLFLGTLENLEKIDLKIEENLKTWKKERLSKIVLSILRLGTFEMIYYKTPINIAIDESIKLAQKYASKEDSLYINGVLGGISKELESNFEKAKV